MKLQSGDRAVYRYMADPKMLGQVGYAALAFGFKEFADRFYIVYRLLADGSVRFIAETIFRPTFAALSSIAQGEVVGDY